MDRRKLGYSIIINNVHSEFEQIREDVEEWKDAGEEVGFEVKIFNDCDEQVLFLNIHLVGRDGGGGVFNKLY